jgi:hypothetical protein
MVAACAELRIAACSADGCEGGKLIRNGKDGDIICPMEAFAEYIATTEGSGSFPVAPAQFADKLYAFIQQPAGRVGSGRYRPPCRSMPYE